MPYELNVHASLDPANSTVALSFFNTGNATAVFQVRSGNPADLVRTYTVEPGKQLSDSWNAAPSYNLAVYGPNGFFRSFAGSIGGAALDVNSRYDIEGGGTIKWQIANLTGDQAEVSVKDAYTGEANTRLVQRHGTFEDELSVDRFHGWYDLIVTVAGDRSFNYRLAGHVETGKDSFSDPALGGLVTLQAEATPVIDVAAKVVA